MRSPMSGLPAWAAAGLLLLALGLPWSGPQTVHRAGSGPSCIADLSGNGPLICDYIGTPGYTERVAGVVGAESPARLFLVLALCLIAWSVSSRRPQPLLAAAGSAVLAVAVTLPEVVSGQVTALLAAVLLLAAVGGTQRVRSLRSATWGETEGSSPSPSAR